MHTLEATQVVVAVVKLVVEVVAMVVKYALGTLVIHLITAIEEIWLEILKEILLVEMMAVTVALILVVLGVVNPAVLAEVKTLGEVVMAMMTLILSPMASSCNATFLPILTLLSSWTIIINRYAECFGLQVWTLGLMSLCWRMVVLTTGAS